MLYFDIKKPYKIFYASIASEILLIARTTADLINMLKRVNLLLIQKKKQGSECPCIIFIEKDVYTLRCICCSILIGYWRKIVTCGKLTLSFSLVALLQPVQGLVLRSRNTGVNLLTIVISSGA